MKWLKCFNRRCHLWVRPGTMLYSWPKSGWVIDVNGLKILREDPYLCWGFRNFFIFINKFSEKFPGRVLVFSPLHPLCASMPVLPNQCSTSQSEMLRNFFDDALYILLWFDRLFVQIPFLPERFFEVYFVFEWLKI